MTPARIAGVVLAGGRGVRLGAAMPKPLVDLGGRPMVAHVLARFPPEIAPVAINANDVEAFAELGYPVVPDRLAGLRGPLAGLDAAAAWLRRGYPPITHLLAVPGDTPFLPGDFAARMTREPGPLPRIAAAGGELQPTAALWPLTVLDGLGAHLGEDRDRSIRGFLDRSGFETVAFDISGDPFFNVNLPQDLLKARLILDL